MESMTGTIVYQLGSNYGSDLKRICITDVEFKSNFYIKDDYTIKFRDGDKNTYEIHITNKIYCRMCKFYKKNEDDVNFTMDGWKEIWGFLIKMGDVISISYGSMR